MVVISARDVACTAGTRPAAIECLVHGRQHGWMLSHSKIVVRTPDRHLLFPVGGMERCTRKSAYLALQIGEGPVPTLLTQFIEPLAEIRVIVHGPTWSWDRCCSTSLSLSFSSPAPFGANGRSEAGGRHHTPAGACRLL